MIQPGLLSAQAAAEINEALRFVRGLRNLSVIPPLRKVPGPDGQSIIALDTSQFLRNPNSISGSGSGSGSSSEAGPTIVIGTFITGQECIGGVIYVTRMDLVATDGFIGLENPVTSIEGCCACGCACEPTFYSYARLTFANRTGDLIAAMPNYIDIPLNVFNGCILSNGGYYFGEGAWSAAAYDGVGAWSGGRFYVSGFMINLNADPYTVSFGLSADSVGSMNAGVATDDTGWTSTPSIISRTYSASVACGDAPSRHIGRYSFTGDVSYHVPATGEFDLYVDLIP